MECKALFMLVKILHAISIDLTRMECKDEAGNDFKNYVRRIDLTRMECKDYLEYVCAD